MGAARKDMGDGIQAVALFKRRLALEARQTTRAVATAPETEALALVRRPDHTLDACLATTLEVREEAAATVYDRVWPFKGLLLQLLARRHQAAVVAAAEAPDARATWQRLVDVRLRLNHLAVVPGKDPKARERRLVALVEEQEHLERALLKYLPDLERHRHLAGVGPKQLYEKLAPETAFVDVVRYAVHRETRFVGHAYQAFVLAPGRAVQRVDLGPA